MQSEVVRVYLEAQLHQVVALEGGVRAGHGDDFGLLHQQILGAVQPTPEQFKGPELLQDEKEEMEGWRSY